MIYELAQLQEKYAVFIFIHSSKLSAIEYLVRYQIWHCFSKLGILIGKMMIIYDTIQECIGIGGSKFVTKPHDL